MSILVILIDSCLNGGKEKRLPLFGAAAERRAVDEHVGTTAVLAGRV